MRRKRSKMVHASLFSGIGGFEIAAEYMGWENAFHCEINEWCSKILKYYFPNSEHYEDITKTKFSKWRGKVDVLTGGFPCQPFSLAGQRKGANDERYLWPEMLRVIREVQPTFVIGENVAGIVSMVQPGCEVTVESQASLFEAPDKETLLEQEYVIETVCSDLEREGYSVQPILIPACSIGAPHRRDRVWFIAHRNSFRRKQGRSVCGRKANNKKNRKRVQFEVGRFGKKWFTANSDGERCDDGAIIGKNDVFVTTKNGTPRKVNQNGQNGSLGLARYVQMLPTPQARDFKGQCAKTQSCLPNHFGTSQLNPLFVAEMMGFPIDWTVLPFLGGEKKV